MSDDVIVSRGLGSPVVTVPDAGHMAAKGKDAQGAARVFYVAAKQAAQRLVIGWDGGLEESSTARKSLKRRFSRDGLLQ